MVDSITPRQLAEIGNTLCGDHWQAPLSKMLNVSDRSLRRWLTGEKEIPIGVVRTMKSALFDLDFRLQGLMWELRHIDTD